jgi:outer membrane autotransporter protein
MGGVGASNGTVAVIDGNGGYASVAPDTDRFAMWGQGFGSWGKWNGDGNAAKFDRSTGGFIAGADGAVLDTLRLGAFAGYSTTRFDVDARNSSGSSENYHAGLYGGTTWGGIAFRSGLAYSWHDVTTTRSVAFTGFGDRLKANYDAGTAQAFGELAYGVHAGPVAFEPFANLAYVNLRTDGFTESGGAAALTSASSAIDGTFTTLGLRASSSFMLGTVNATAKGSLGWRHAFGDTTPLSTFSFGSGSPFIIAGVPIAQDATVLDLGMDFNVTPDTVLGVSYGGQFGSGMTDQTLRANFSAKF